MMFNENDTIAVVTRDDNGNVIRIRESKVDSVSTRQIKVGNEVFSIKGVSKKDSNECIEHMSDEYRNFIVNQGKSNAYKCARDTYSGNISGDVSRRFNVGDVVCYGAGSSAVVADIYDDGMFYGLNVGNKCYDVRPWFKLYATDNTTESMIMEWDNKIYFAQQRISSLLHKVYCGGVNFEPCYQRGFDEWSLKQKELLIESIFMGVDIGKFVFIVDSEYEILDGKQRLSTIVDFYEDRLVYKGKRFSELSLGDRMYFEGVSVAVGEAQELSLVQRCEYFLRLNRGTVVSKEHLEYVEGILENLKKN